MAFINTVVGRAAASIWGLKLGNATMDAVLAQSNSTVGGINTVVNQAFNTAYSSYSNEEMAAAFANNLGLTGQARTDGEAYTLNVLNGVASEARGAALLETANLFSTLTDPLYGPFAAAFNAKVAGAVAYSSQPGSIDAVLGNLPSATTFNLTLGQDNATATGGDDAINAYIFDNSNTLQSGDYVDGGAGLDTLYADMGSSQNFAVTPITRNVENIAIRAQSRAVDSGDNNIAGEGRVLIDAERIEGESRYESNNSRADLLVEDVRIASSQITKDITIAMVQTDPGNVDFGVYFDQPSLRANATSSATLTLQVLDQFAAAAGLDPLLDSPYDGVRFNYNGTDVQVRSQALNDATTYPEFLAELQALLAAEPLAAGITATLGSDFTVVDSNGVPVTGTSIVLSASGTTASFAPGSWIASAGVPADSSLYTNQFVETGVSNDLITSTIVLDDVGRGSNGGSLVVGGLSVGETSSSKGVERFDITVERTSRLQNIDSTNNSLKEVVVKNGLSKGDLTVLGNAANPDGSLPGHAKDTWGFNDVRLVDGSMLDGKFNFDALVSSASFAKYMLLTDTQGNPAGDNTSLPGKTTQRADFIYSGGGNADSMTIVVDGGIAASNSTIQSGREDFTFKVNGNAGDDSIAFRIVSNNNDGFLDNWYQHQRALANVTIDAGTGNDTVRTPGAGDAIIRLGDGNDVVYVDNSGGDFYNTDTGAITNVNPSAFAGDSRENAMFVFNTDHDGLGFDAADRRDMLSDSNDNSRGANNGSLFRAEVTVTYMGLTASATLPADVYRPTDLYVNQAIKAAINGDPVLNKLLVAQDGPGYSLVVKSLIDGFQVLGDLDVELTQATAAEFTTSVIQAAMAALAPTDPTPTAAELQAFLDNGKANFDAKGDYNTVFANDGFSDITGNDSFTPSDNTVTPGAGDDVIVLGTNSGSGFGDELVASNDTVVYSGSFGNDVIVNFSTDTADFGGDVLDISLLGYDGDPATFDPAPGTPAPAAASTASADNAMFIRIEDNATNTAAEIAGLFVNDAANTTAKSWVYVAVDADNVGTVYSLVDAVNTGGITATLAGSIDLADTPWATLTAVSFGG